MRELISLRLVASHLLVLAVMAGCVAAGLWQWDRLGQARAANELAESRMSAEPVDLDELLAADGAVDVEELEHRRVEVAGAFRPEQEVLQRNREHQGTQGLHVLTPLELADGRVLLVRRGSVPTHLDEPPVREAAAPEGTVRVTGLLEAPVPQPSFGATDPAEGHLERVFHTDTQRLDRQVDGELLDLVLRLEEPAPADGELPIPAGSPTLDEANHLSYALQWFSFAVLALVTYAVWLRRRARRGPRRRDDPRGLAAAAAGAG